MLTNVLIPALAIEGDAYRGTRELPALLNTTFDAMEVNVS